MIVSRKTAPVPDAVPFCPACHGPRQFEMQLLPGFVYFLRPDCTATAVSGPLDTIPDSADEVVTFNSVLLYTCTSSCWRDELRGSEKNNPSDATLYRNEYLFIQHEMECASLV